MTKRLVRDGRATINQLLDDVTQARSDLADVHRAQEEAQKWNQKREPIDVARHLRESDRALLSAERTIDAIERRIRGELEELLRRREDNTPAPEDRLTTIERQLAELATGLRKLQDERPPFQVIKRDDAQSG